MRKVGGALGTPNLNRTLSGCKLSNLSNLKHHQASRQWPALKVATVPHLLNLAVWRLSCGPWTPDPNPQTLNFKL